MMKIGYAEERESMEWSEDVFLTQLVFGEKMSVQHYRFEPGSRVDTHSHPHEQSGFIYQGSLTFLSDGREETLGAGDSYVIPGGEPHAVENRGETPALGVDIFSPPRGEPDWEKPG